MPNARNSIPSGPASKARIVSGETRTASHSATSTISSSSFTRPLPATTTYVSSSFTWWWPNGIRAFGSRRWKLTPVFSASRSVRAKRASTSGAMPDCSAAFFTSVRMFACVNLVMRITYPAGSSSRA